MIFEHHKPQGILGRYVESLIYFEHHETSHLIDRFLPDGNVELVINLHDEPQYIYDNDTLKEIQKCERSWASGVRTKPISIPSGDGARMFVVIFKKGMAHPFFPMPMDQIRDQVVEADIIWKNEIVMLREMIGSAQDGALRFSVVEAFLMDLLVPNMRPRPFVEYGVSRILDDPSQARLASIADEVGYSKKHFIDKFKKDVGVSPKSYSRIIRFQKTISEIETRELDWTNLALDCGYYDQAHFINDFRSFSGFTPVDYSKKKNGNLNYVPVAER